MSIYTGRKIALFADSHGLYEPTLAILQDMKKKGINEIYSLGDNFGLGPNPNEVFHLLEEYHVTSICGNSEYYINFGYEPFYYYFTKEKKESLKWTVAQLDDKSKRAIQLYPHFIELMVGGKKIGLCHFANDVRIPMILKSTFSYQSALKKGKSDINSFFIRIAIKKKRKLIQ